MGWLNYYAQPRKIHKIDLLAFYPLLVLCHLKKIKPQHNSLLDICLAAEMHLWQCKLRKCTEQRPNKITLLLPLRLMIANGQRCFVFSSPSIFHSKSRVQRSSFRASDHCKVPLLLLSFLLPLFLFTSSRTAQKHDQFTSTSHNSSSSFHHQHHLVEFYKANSIPR